MTTVRIGDREREATVGALRTAYEAGCLDLAELEQRVDAAWAGRTQLDLDALTADLPARPAPRAKHARPPAAHGDPGPAVRDRVGGHRPARAHGGALARAHAATFAATMLALVAIWLLTGAGHPWPLWVALGWGPAALGGRRHGPCGWPARRFTTR